MLLSSIISVLIIFECLHYGSARYYNCPIGFEFLSSRCYKAVKQPASWPEAKVYCQVLGGDLASVSSIQEAAIIIDLIARHRGSTSEQRYWIDGMRIVFDYEWRWMRTNGQSVPFRYTNWYPGQPERKNERCVAAYGDNNGQWHDHWCDHMLNSVCSAQARSTSNSLEIMSNNVDALEVEENADV